MAVAATARTEKEWDQFNTAKPNLSNSKKNPHTHTPTHPNPDTKCSFLLLQTKAGCRANLQLKKRAVKKNGKTKSTTSSNLRWNGAKQKAMKTMTTTTTTTKSILHKKVFRNLKLGLRKLNSDSEMKSIDSGALMRSIFQHRHQYINFSWTKPSKLFKFVEIWLIFLTKRRFTSVSSKTSTRLDRQLPLSNSIFQLRRPLTELTARIRNRQNKTALN